MELQEQGRLLVAKGEVAGGLSLLEDAAMHAVSGTLGPLATGVIFCNAIDVCRRLADFGRAIELDAKLTSAFYNRGIARLRKDDFDGAIGDLSRAIELSPKTADYYNDRGLAKLGKGDDDGAIADFTRAIGLDPKNALAYRNRALAKNNKKDADGAPASDNKPDDSSSASQTEEPE